MPAVPHRAQVRKVLVCDVADVRLVARSIEGQADYLVLRPSAADERDLQNVLAKGAADDLGTAMATAERLLGELGLSAAEWKVLQ